MTDESSATRHNISVVYFVRIGKFIKVGVTTNLPQRISSFRTTAIDIEVLLTIPGTYDLEHRIHGLLKEARVERELFHYDWRVSSFIMVVERSGLDHGIRYLEETTEHRRAQRRQLERDARTRQARQSRAEQDAYYASLVAERKRTLGW